MKNHDIWMIIGCVLPLLLIFILPLVGITGGTSLFLLMVVVFGAHLLMMRGHGRGQDQRGSREAGHHGTH